MERARALNSPYFQIKMYNQTPMRRAAGRGYFYISPHICLSVCARTPDQTKNDTDPPPELPESPTASG